MKKAEGFWRGLEKYTWKLVGRSPLPWAWVGVGAACSIIVISWSYGGQTVVGARDIREVVERAAGRGDYDLARGLYEAGDEKVLGAESEIEDKIYPERIVERRISEIEEKLKKYPGNREIYLILADLYGQVGNQELASEYREKARILDPNN